MINKRGQLCNKTILILGATSEIGLCISDYCINEGAEVFLLGRNESKLDKIISQNPEKNPQKIVLSEQSPLFNDFFKHLPTKFDGIVSCIGEFELKPIHFETMYSILKKFESHFGISATILSLLKKNKQISSNGSIVLISSINGTKVSCMGGSIYGALKAAMSGFCKGLSLEFAHNGTRVNCICPGVIDTEKLHKNFSIEEIKNMTRMNPLGYLGEPKDVAELAIFLLSDKSRWITGTDIVIDGGYSIK